MACRDRNHAPGRRLLSWFAYGSRVTWARPIPLVGDTTTAAERAADPQAWAFPAEAQESLRDIMAARRDVRRFRADPVAPEVVDRVLAAGHAAPSVGHSQPWRFIVVREAMTRTRAAAMADRERLRQAALLEPDAGRRLLDLQLEGIREAPVGIVVCCDRRTAAAGVLGRATFPDADLWSCACAIQNIWLSARAEGLGLGWVTLFPPSELAGLLHLPEGVVTLGWLCLGWPDERQPVPGLERAGWSRRQALADVVLAERWPDPLTPLAAPQPPPSALRAPQAESVVATRDRADVLLTPPGSLGALDRALDRVLATRPTPVSHTSSNQGGPAVSGCLVLVAGRHLVTRHGVSAYADSVTDDVLAASRAGESLGAVAARDRGFALVVEDAGTATGDLVTGDALSPSATTELLARGRELGRRAAGRAAADELRLVALGEIGVGNTTVAAALAAALLGLPAARTVGLGAGADTPMRERKAAVVDAALARVLAERGELPADPETVLASVGGPEFAVLTGVVLGAVVAGAVVVCDGLATTVCALLARRLEPGIADQLLAGQQSREAAHGLVLTELGLEPLLDLRLRAGEGVGAMLAAGLLVAGLVCAPGSAVRPRTLRRVRDSRNQGRLPKCWECCWRVGLAATAADRRLRI